MARRAVSHEAFFSRLTRGPAPMDMQEPGRKSTTSEKVSTASLKLMRPVWIPVSMRTRRSR